MADYDSALPVRGNVEDGAAVYTQNTVLIVGGSDGSNYQQLNVDTAGRQLVVGAADDDSAVAGAPVLFAGKYEATPDAVDDGDAVTLALDAYGRVIAVGQVADGSNIDANAFPVLMAGQDGTDVQSLLTDSSGRLLVVVGGGRKDTVTYASVNLVKDTPTVVHSIVGPTTITMAQCAGSGLMKVEYQWGVTASEETMKVKFNSTAFPNVDAEFPNGLDIASGETFQMLVTNLENAASPTSDFDGYGTIHEETLV